MSKKIQNIVNNDRLGINLLLTLTLVNKAMTAEQSVSRERERLRWRCMHVMSCTSCHWWLVMMMHSLQRLASSHAANRDVLENLINHQPTQPLQPQRYRCYRHEQTLRCNYSVYDMRSMHATPTTDELFPLLDRTTTTWSVDSKLSETIGTICC